MNRTLKDLKDQLLKDREFWETEDEARNKGIRRIRSARTWNALRQAVEDVNVNSRWIEGICNRCLPSELHDVEQEP